jgi:uncharacterized DUF497 family protein
MQYEYDPAKSAANKEKHGIDFEEAKALWADDGAAILDARSDTERRHAVIGRIGEVFWTAFITYRDENTRIISVRRSRAQEVAIYEKELARRRA